MANAIKDRKPEPSITKDLASIGKTIDHSAAQRRGKWDDRHRDLVDGLYELVNSVAFVICEYVTLMEQIRLAPERIENRITFALSIKDIRRKWHQR